MARIGRRSPAVDAVLRGWGVRQAAFLGAWNPYSRPMPPGWNCRMDRALAGWLRRVPHVCGEGELRRWREAHALAALPPAKAARLARRFRQAAMVTVRAGQAARLQVLATWRVR